MLFWLSFDLHLKRTRSWAWWERRNQAIAHPKTMIHFPMMKTFMILLFLIFHCQLEMMTTIARNQCHWRSNLHWNLRSHRQISRQSLKSCLHLLSQNQRFLIGPKISPKNVGCLRSKIQINHSIQLLYFNQTRHVHEEVLPLETDRWLPLDEACLGICTWFVIVFVRLNKDRRIPSVQI